MIHHKKLLIFDLDGTLIDSLDDLYEAVKDTLLDINMPSKTKEEVRKAIGHGSKSLLFNCLPQSEAHRLEEFHPLFLQHYNRHCSKHTKLYPGVIDFIDKNTQDKALLTNKPQVPTEMILETFGLKEKFKVVVGGDLFKTRKPHPEGIEYILKTLQVAPQDAIMIGDGVPDIQTAHAIGMESIAILGGLTDPEDLKAVKPTYTIEHFSDLIR